MIPKLSINQAYDKDDDDDDDGGGGDDDNYNRN